MLFFCSQITAGRVFTGHESCNISWLAVDGLNLYQPTLGTSMLSSDLKSVHVCKIRTSTGKQCNGGVARMYVSLDLSLKKTHNTSFYNA
jgi:hypothetical protein